MTLTWPASTPTATAKVSRVPWAPWVEDHWVSRSTPAASVDHWATAARGSRGHGARRLFRKARSTVTSQSAKNSPSAPDGTAKATFVPASGNNNTSSVTESEVKTTAVSGS